ncbi:MAG: alkaline phosphatase family protein [Candidatus Omnitrophica bacterium]|nr:alkaline phosphatase family protein [Candidatus Omnitrophota bacterium]
MIRKIFFFAIVWILGMTAGIEIRGIIRSHANRPRNIILIGWDGVQRNHLKECLARGEVPNLAKLASEGNLVAIDNPRSTETKCGWTQVLTGYEPEVTYVYTITNFHPIPRGYTIFERLEQFFGPENFVTAAILGKQHHTGNEPLQRWDGSPRSIRDYRRKSAHPGLYGVEHKLVKVHGKEYFVKPGEPYYRSQENMDVFIHGLHWDDLVGAKALELLEKYKDHPFFFFVLLAQVDWTGHRHGENSKEYTDAIILADSWTGKIIDKLKELNLYDKTLIYITTDHGFGENLSGHVDAPYGFLATNDPKVMRRGFLTDIAATILDRFGINLKKIQPSLDGHPLTKPYKPPRF